MTEDLESQIEKLKADLKQLNSIHADVVAQNMFYKQHIVDVWNQLSAQNPDLVHASPPGIKFQTWQTFEQILKTQSYEFNERYRFNVQSEFAQWLAQNMETVFRSFVEVQSEPPKPSNDPGVHDVH